MMNPGRATGLPPRRAARPRPSGAALLSTASRWRRAASSPRRNGSGASCSPKPRPTRTIARPSSSSSKQSARPRVWGRDRRPLRRPGPNRRRGHDKSRPPTRRSQVGRCGRSTPRRTGDRALRRPHGDGSCRPETLRPLARCGSAFIAASAPWLASFRTNGSVALLSAKAEVRATAPGMLATQ